MVRLLLRSLSSIRSPSAIRSLRPILRSASTNAPNSGNHSLVQQLKERGLAESITGYMHSPHFFEH